MDIHVFGGMCLPATVNHVQFFRDTVAAIKHSCHAPGPKAVQVIQSRIIPKLVRTTLKVPMTDFFYLFVTFY